MPPRTLARPFSFSPGVWATLPLLVLVCHCTDFVIDPPVPGGAAGTGSGGGPQGGGGGGAGGFSGGTTGGERAQMPALTDDVYTLLQGETLTVSAAEGVLSNDRPLKLRVRGVPRLISSVPSQFTGQLVLEEDGAFVFQPEPRFFGVYGLEYTAENESGQSAPAELWFRVLPERISLDVIESGLGGYVLRGSEAGHFGAALAPAGDLNGDGLADLLVGAPDTAQGKGAAYLVYGKEDLSPVDVLSNAPSSATGVYTAFSAGAGETLGVSVAGLGDVDRDGLPDLGLGANGANAGAGRVYVVAGRRTFARQFALPDPGGMVIEGDAGNQDVGRVVAGAADVDGDGQRDILINSNNLKYGWLHVLFGGTGVTGAVPIFGLAGLHLRAAVEEDLFPTSAAAIGDFNGDGASEILASSQRNIVVVEGGETYPDHIGALPIDGAEYGFRLERAQAGAGSVAALGDVDHDGVPDFGYCDGRACRVVLAPPVTLANGWEIAGFSRRTSQVQITGGADFDLDGFSDIVLAEPGRVYVVYGRGSGYSQVDVANLGAEGYDILPARGGSGFSTVSVIGDVNRDGAPDLAIADAGRDEDSGRVYVVLGVPRIQVTQTE